MDEPATKAKKEPEPLIIDWLTKLKKINQRIESVIQPLQENKDLVREAVMPLVSAGSQASEFLSSLKAGVQPSLVEMWDFASGSQLLQPSIPQSYLKSKSFADYQDFLVREVAPVVEEGKEVAKTLQEQLDPAKAAREMQDFHESLGAAQFVSVSLEETAREVGKKEKNLLARIETWLGSISDNIGKIKDKIGHTVAGTVRGIADEALGALVEFKSALKTGGQAVVNAFRELCKFVGNLLLRILSGLFDFITRIQAIAKDKGFPLSDVTLELEGAGVDVAVVAGFPFPVPKFKPPKITMKFGAP
jgi:hypothetical protein